MLTLVNLTPHALTLRNAETGTDTVLPPSGTVARVSTTPGYVMEKGDGFGYTDCPVPVYSPSTVGEITGLPDAVSGTLYVVSALVLAAVNSYRLDVVGPGTGPNDGAIRNDKGQIIAVTRLVRG